jgi:hypothetical protein
MSAIGYVEPGVEATSAPPLIRRAGHAPLGALVLAIASVWLAAAISGTLAGRAAIVPGLGSSGAFWAGVVGAALAALALHWIVRRQTVVIDGGALVVSERSLLGGHTWREPLANYREIRGSTEQRPHRYGRRTWYIVQLSHPEAAKKLELARARDRAAIEALARDYARRLGLPLTWEQPESGPADQAEVHAADHRSRGQSQSAIATAAVPGRSLSTR